MNRNLLVYAVALGAVAALGALYSTLTDAAPASSAALGTPQLPASAFSAASVVVAIEPTTSPEVARLDARRQLYESVDALVQASEFEKARQLLDEDQDRYGDDLAPQWRDLEQSYRLIADCLERPTAQLRVRAQAFVLVSQASSLRRRILEACAPSRP